MPEEEPPEDYGYDLAHEVPPGPDRRKPHPSYQSGPHPQSPGDTSTDYSSDEAHDL